MNLVINLNQLEDLDEAIKVSNQVFRPSPSEAKRYHNKDDWLEIIEDDGLLIIAKDDNMVVGYSVCYPKRDKFHIWNVGVLESYRRIGVWRQMYEAILKFAKEKGFKHLTLNTYRDKFPQMCSFCLNQGFGEYKTEKGKSFLIRSI